MRLTPGVQQRPVALVVLSIAAVALGIFGLTSLEVDYLPDVTYPMVRIHVWWPGATPEDIERNIAEPLERAMATVDNLDYLSSSSIEGMYTLLVNFRYGVNVDVAYQDVMAIMGRAQRRLPPGIDPPMVMKADPSQLPVLEVTVASDRYDLVWLREWADRWLSDRIAAIPGTAGAEVVGGFNREIRVHLDPARLAAFSLSPGDVVRAIRDENRQIFAGRVTLETREIIARTMGEFEDLDEIRNTVVFRGLNGALVHVRDLASVEDSHEEARVITRFNSRPCVKVNVLKQAEANTVLVAREVKSFLDQIQDDIPEGIDFGVVENQGDYVMGAILSVRDSALAAAILVVLVVYLFLGHWRQVAVMAVALPLTLLANFFVMKAAGFSLNLFSLGGLVVALGVILDNSIVVLENITRLSRESHGDGKSVTDAVVATGTAQVAPAITAATLTFLGVFAPFLLVPGLASLLFRELVLVVASIVAISLLVAVTVTPVLAGRLVVHFGSGRRSRLTARFDQLMDRALAAYTRLLAGVLKWRLAVVIVFCGLFALGIHLARMVGSEFLPSVDDGRVMVKVIMPAGTSVSETDRVLAGVEERLQGFPEIESVFTLAGGRVWGLATYEIAQEGEVNIQLVRRSQRDISTAEFVEKIAPIVRQGLVPGARMPVMQMRVKGIRRIGEQTVEVKVQGAELQPIYEFAQLAARTLEETQGLVNVNISMDMTKPEYRISIDRARASALGLSAASIAATLRTLVGGTISTEFREGNEYYGIRVIVPESELRSREDLENLILETRSGRSILVRDVARVSRAVGPVEISRESQIKQILVRADAAPGLSIGAAVARARAAVEALPRDRQEVGFAMGGQAELMADNNRVMRAILFFSILFAYTVLAIQFNSYILPILAMLGFPFALTGAFGALFAFEIPIGITVMIGLVVMMGGVTSQGVVLLTLVESTRRAGFGTTEAVLHAAPLRLRPIVMTQMTTIFGLLPLALNLGEGGDMLKPMAIAVIGGLCYSLVLTLFFLPAMYVLVVRGRRHSVADEAIGAIPVDADSAGADNPLKWE